MFFSTAPTEVTYEVVKELHFQHLKPDNFGGADRALFHSLVRQEDPSICEFILQL